MHYVNKISINCEVTQLGSNVHVTALYRPTKIYTEPC